MKIYLSFISLYALTFIFIIFFNKSLLSLFIFIVFKTSQNQSNYFINYEIINHDLSFYYFRYLA